ncbi:sensor histidine kinase [Clostridium saccharoperbutylacetonicum]|uniref:sensor histidine kinase n=1 Tax=Clostridium saccharoperbutylacetonicum TaxID=36745 RepID=UPI0039EA2ECC
MEDIDGDGKVKNEFISSISHELRTPLTGIKGWIETMQSPNEMTDEELRFGLKIINGESERLINLVENLLDFSRYQADRIELNISKFNLDELIREGAFQLQKKAEKKEIRVIVEAVAFIFKAARDKLKQVILNVLDNAIKFSYKDSSIYVTQAVNNNSVIIEISDSGIGIKEEELEYVMRSFYKIYPKLIGARFGLVISRNIVEMHKGTIQIESEYEKAHQ